MDLDATPLKAFLKIAEMQSFTRAAETLNVSQPALSAMIKELERRLGFRLFERNSRNVTISRAGRDFQIYARRVVIETEWMRLRARAIATNDLKLAVQHHSVLMPVRLAVTDGFFGAHPEVTVQIRQLDHSALYRAVDRNDVDVALVVEPTERLEISPLHPDARSDWELAVLARRPFGLFVPEGHGFAGADAIALDALSGVEIAVPDSSHGGAIASAVMRTVEQAGAIPVRPPRGGFRLRDALCIAKGRYGC